MPRRNGLLKRIPCGRVGQVRKSRSKVDKSGGARVTKTGQTGQTGRTNAEKRAANVDKLVRSGSINVESESLTASAAARELGISSRTLRRLCSTGQLRSFSTPGGQIRVWRTQLDAYRQGLVLSSRSAPSSALESRRESLQSLTLELQERRLRRDLKKLEEEDAQGESDRDASIEAEELRNRAAIEQAREQRESREAQREREREQEEADQHWQQWSDSWLEFALRSLPRGVPQEVTLCVQQAVEEALSSLTPTRPRAIIEHAVAGAIERGLAPWKRLQEVELVIKQAREQLPFAVRHFGDWLPPSEWEARAMSAARQAIAKLAPDASLAEVRSVAMQAGMQVAKECETVQRQQQLQQQQERELQRRASNKLFLVSLGVAEVGPYLRKLHSNDDIFDEDLVRKDELEQIVRSALEKRLTGGELLQDSVRITREVLDSELNA